MKWYQNLIITVAVFSLGITAACDDNNSGTNPSLEESKIAFVSDRDGNNEIYVMNADGSYLNRLTKNNEYDYDPMWSPNGQKIAFTSHRDGNQEIYVMNADGSNQKRLTKNNEYDYAPMWSPNGQKIAFASDRRGYLEIYVMKSDGSDQTRLTTNTLNTFGDYDPMW